ncbi:hypothetical protein [Alishewanella longhuensis]
MSQVKSVVPLNSRSSATTNDSGAFVSSGLRVGGPYRITITSDQGTKVFDNVFLWSSRNLG